MNEIAFSLHPQLDADTVPLGDLPLSRVLLTNDAQYPWLILVPRMPGVTELTDLDPNEQVQLLGEIDFAARALKTVTAFEKLNIAMLGNMVKQLHIHVIGRFAADAAWPKPVWGVVTAKAYDAEARNVLVNKLRHELKL